MSVDTDIEPMGQRNQDKGGSPRSYAVKQHNGRMGGTDKNDMLTHQYKSLIRAQRFQLKLFWVHCGRLHLQRPDQIKKDARHCGGSQ